MQHEPGAPRDSIDVMGFDPPTYADDELLVLSFKEDVQLGLSPFFRGELRPMAFPSVPEAGRLLTHEDVAAIPWQFQGVHDGAAFRQLEPEDPPRTVSFAGVHLIDRNGDDALRLFDEVGLLAQLGAVTSSRRIGRKPDLSQDEQ